MSNVVLRIAGRRYTVACEDGEEDHVAMLGATIDRKIGELPNFGGQAEARTLLFAALLLADELHEKQAQAEAAGQDAQVASAIAEPLEKLAEKLEGISVQLERARTST